MSTVLRGSMKEEFNLFLSSICAGIAISIGGTVLLSVADRVIGSLLFTFGLCTIVINGFALFTGQVGYLVVQENKRKYLLRLSIVWIGNLIGTILSGLAIRQTRISGIAEVAREICAVKLSDEMVSTFILATFCGMIMYVAVDGYKERKTFVILFLCVAVFILCGFEHCIANMYFFTIAGAWSLKTVGYLLIMTIGNSVGGMILPLLKSKIFKNEDSYEKDRRVHKY